MANKHGLRVGGGGFPNSMSGPRELGIRNMQSFPGVETREGRLQDFHELLGLPTSNNWFFKLQGTWAEIRTSGEASTSSS